MVMMRCPVDCTFVLVLETMQGSALEKCKHSESGRLSFSAKHSLPAVEVNGTEQHTYLVLSQILLSDETEDLVWQSHGLKRP